MKSMAINFKILFMLTGIFTIFSASAQYKQDPEKNAKKQSEWMKTELALSEEQVSKIEAINLSYAKKRKALKEEMHKQMKSLREDKQKELSAVLTKEQAEKYEKKKAEMKVKRREHYKKGKGQCPEKK